MPSRSVRCGLGGAALALTLVLLGVHAPASGGATISSPAAQDTELAERGWVWPLAGFRIAREYVAPAHEYGPGHRGIDLEALATPGVRAPAAGVVAFAGSIADRGIVTIDHGDGLVTTLEPVSAVVAAGERIARGQEIAMASVGGHSAVGTLHFGVRLHGEYINPLLLLGGIPPAVLLPCCGALP